MEPRSWKWIQAAVIAVAMAVGIGVAVWYQNRPVAEALPAPAAMPGRKLIRHFANPDTIPNIAPLKPTASSVSSSVNDLPAPDATGAAPYRLPTAGQSTIVDPMITLPTPKAAPVSEAPTVPSPRPTDLATPANVAPSVGLSPGAPVAPSASPTDVPSVNVPAGPSPLSPQSSPTTAGP